MANDDSIGKELMPHPGEFDEDDNGKQIAPVPLHALEQMSRAEIDIQIATAQRYPRSITAFRKSVLECATMDVYVAEKCFYRLSRGGKTIEGPSARMAELVASAWGNIRTAGRIVDISDTYVVAQGTAHDLQANNLKTIEVRRRIVDSKGRRYTEDMVLVTCQAAIAIAVRNATFQVVPPLYFESALRAARELAVKGPDGKGFHARRIEVVERFNKTFGVPLEAIWKKLTTPEHPVKGVEDIETEDLETLIGMGVAINDGNATVAELFDIEPKKSEGAAKVAAAVSGAAPAKKAAASKVKEAPPAAEPQPTKSEPKPEPTPEVKPEPPAQAEPPQAAAEPPHPAQQVQEGEFVPEMDSLGDKADEYEENLTKIRQHCREAVLLKSVDPLTVVYPLIRALPDGSPEKAETRKLYMDARAELVKMGVLKADGKAAAK